MEDWTARDVTAEPRAVRRRRLLSTGGAALRPSDVLPDLQRRLILARRLLMNEHYDPYAVLGVTPTATPAEITHAFRAKLRSLHPDTRSAAVGDAELREVLAAYGLLRDSDRRANFDRTATAAAAPWSPRSSGSSAQRRTHANPVGPVQIPVTHGRTDSEAPQAERPLWAGPVRRHS